MTSYPRNWQIESLDSLINRGIIKLNRGDIISKRDIAAHPGDYPIYSSAKENNGIFGRYGKFMFDEEVITWSIDGGGRLFYREKQKFSVTNVGGIMRILDRNVFDYKFLFYALTNLHSQVIFDWSRKAHPSVIRLVYDKIPIPPLPKQHKIVEILEDHLSRLDAALADVKQAKVKASQFRRSLLQAAFTGNLGSNGTGTMTQKSKHWKSKKLEQLIDPIREQSKIVDDKTYELWSIPSFADGLPEIILGKSIGSSKLRVKAGDILISKINPRINRVWIVAESNFEQLASPEWLVARIKGSKEIEKKYLMYYLTSPEFRDWISRSASSVTGSHSRAKANEILKREIPFPPLPEQHKIVEILEDHLSRLEASVALADAMEKQSAGLRRSLLQAAFTGQLTKEVASV